jgi:hypothetical protein
VELALRNKDDFSERNSPEDMHRLAENTAWVEILEVGISHSKLDQFPLCALVFSSS